MNGTIADPEIELYATRSGVLADAANTAVESPTSPQDNQTENRNLAAELSFHLRSLYSHSQLHYSSILRLTFHLFGFRYLHLSHSFDRVGKHLGVLVPEFSEIGRVEIGDRESEAFPSLL